MSSKKQAALWARVPPGVVAPVVEASADAGVPEGPTLPSFLRMRMRGF
ncbi:MULTISPECIES: hypothetical protein [Sandaracinus]|nr:MULTISPECIES: hypothetical protein [Sandaracinus]UJR87327.1 Hypothetical protein I5071_1190 [Sandaracinus amylolyticus]